MYYFKKIVSLQIFLSLLFTSSIYCFDLQKNMIVVGLMGTAGFVGYQIAKKNVTTKKYEEKLKRQREEHAKRFKQQGEKHKGQLEKLSKQHIQEMNNVIKNAAIREQFLITLIAHNSLVIHRYFPNFNAKINAKNCTLSNNKDDNIYTLAIGSHNLYFPYYPSLLRQKETYYQSWIRKFDCEIEKLKQERQII